MVSDRGEIAFFGHDHANGNRTNKLEPNVLFVGIGYASHMGVLLQLMYHLADKYHGLKVTLAATKDRLADVKKLRDKGDLQTLDLRFEAVFGEMPVDAANPRFPTRAALVAEQNINESEAWRKKLIEGKGAPGQPTAIIADMFQYWTKDIADELEIPWYNYCPTCPMLVLAMLEVPKLTELGVFEALRTKSPLLKERMSSIPGLTHLRVGDFALELNRSRDYFARIAKTWEGASGVILNTSEEIDAGAGTVVALRKRLPSTKICTIGPSLQHPGFGFTYTVALAESKAECLEWLDTQAENSVLYVAFGTLGMLADEVIHEIAAGLEASGVPFLWALREDCSWSGKNGSISIWKTLPQGFVERTKGRGIIETGWAPQSKILLHPATGGFLSHMGWNSTLESICSSVPLIAWPLAADQPMNARFIEEVADVGYQVCSAMDENRESFEGIKRRELEKTVRKLFFEEDGLRVRQNISEVSKSLAASVAAGGSSCRQLHALLDDITVTR